MNYTYLPLLFIFCVASSMVHGQKPITERTLLSWPKKPVSETPQPYGDSSLVDMDFIAYRDSAAVIIHPDNETLEIISLSYPTAAAMESEKIVVRLKTFDPKEPNYRFSFSTISFLFVKTQRGVTTILYMWDGGYGYALVNGKIIAGFDGNEFTLGAIIQEDIFRDKIAWAYGTDH